ncbi:MAG: RHS repeat protein, partial [Gammaproteobacteria bacterium]|nr:RHS repeat protein [Gammaproteobacteria bacterium]
DLGQILSMVNALGHTFRLDYHLDGQLAKMTDPAGNEISLDYGYASANAFKGLLNSIS